MSRSHSTEARYTYLHMNDHNMSKYRISLKLGTHAYLQLNMFRTPKPTLGLVTAKLPLDQNAADVVALINAYKV